MKDNGISQYHLTSMSAALGDRRLCRFLCCCNLFGCEVRMIPVRGSRRVHIVCKGSRSSRDTFSKSEVVCVHKRVKGHRWNHKVCVQTKKATIQGVQGAIVWHVRWRKCGRDGAPDRPRRNHSRFLKVSALFCNKKRITSLSR